MLFQVEGESHAQNSGKMVILQSNFQKFIALFTEVSILAVPGDFSGQPEDILQEAHGLR